MEVRPATPTDRSSIRDIARDSFQSSYSLSPQEIASILEHAFSDDALAERIDDSDVWLLVAEDVVEGVEGIQGFVDVVVEEEGTVRWLHVHPNARGGGVATALIEEVKTELAQDDRSFRASVLTDAAEGGEFLEQFGLERSGSDQAEFGGEEYSTVLFTEGGRTEDSNEPAVRVPETVEDDGADRFLDEENAIPGTNSPFFHLYSDREQTDPYGYFCSQCASTDVSADSLDRLVCNECGNLHNADEWDGAFL